MSGRFGGRCRRGLFLGLFFALGRPQTDESQEYGQASCNGGHPVNGIEANRVSQDPAYDAAHERSDGAGADDPTNGLPSRDGRKANGEHGLC